MKHLATLQNKSELTIQTSKITQSLAVALERTQTPPFDLTIMVGDIEREFKKIPIEHIQKAIRNGSLGEYGRTYKFSTQEVCIWIRSYLESKKSKLGV